MPWTIPSMAQATSRCPDFITSATGDVVPQRPWSHTTSTGVHLHNRTVDIGELQQGNRNATGRWPSHAEIIVQKHQIGDEGVVQIGPCKVSLVGRFEPIADHGDGADGRGTVGAIPVAQNRARVVGLPEKDAVETDVVNRGPISGRWCWRCGARRPVIEINPAPSTVHTDTAAVEINYALARPIGLNDRRRHWGVDRTLKGLECGSYVVVIGGRYD